MWSWFSSADEQKAAEPESIGSSANLDYHWEEVRRRQDSAGVLKEQTWDCAESQRPQMYNDSHSRALNKVQRGYFRDDALVREHRGQSYAYGAYKHVPK